MATDSFYSLTVPQGFAAVAAFGTTNPGNLVALSGLPAWTDLGGVSTAGLVENPSQTRSEFKRWGSISPFAAVITDQKHEFQVTFIESNPNVLGVVYRNGGPLTPSGSSVNEVQTVTITGAPTGGTFVLDYNGNPTTDLAFNASTAAVQTALQLLPGLSGNVTVSGTAGSSYVLTFAGALAATNVAQVVAVGNFTGGTSPAISVATTTGGAPGSLLTVTDDTAGVRDIRALCFDLVSGTNKIRFYCPQAEMTALGNIAYKFDGLIEYQCTFTAYPNASGIAVQRQFLLDALRLGV